MPGTNSHHLWVDPTSRMPHQIQKLEQADPQVTTCPFFPSTFSRNLRFPRRFCRPPPTPFRSPLFVDFLRSPPSLPAPLAWRRSPTRPAYATAAAVLYKPSTSRRSGSTPSRAGRGVAAPSQQVRLLLLRVMHARFSRRYIFFICCHISSLILMLLVLEFVGIQMHFSSWLQQRLRFLWSLIWMMCCSNSTT